MLIEMSRIPEIKAFHPPRLINRPSPEWTNTPLTQTREEKRRKMLCNSKLNSSLEELLWALYQKSGHMVDTSNFAIAVYDDGSNTLSFPLIFDQGQRIKPFSIKLSDSQELTSWVLRSQTPLLIHNLPTTGIIVETTPICPDQPIRSWLSVPIVDPTHNHSAHGAIVVWSDQPNAFTDHQLELLSTLGTQAAIDLKNAHLQSVLEERDRVMEAEEQIRKDLARDLHDGPLQLVSALIMRLDICRKTLKKEKALPPEQIDYLQEVAERAVHQMRTMLFALRPIVLETQGLVAALRVLLERRQKTVEKTTLNLDIETDRPDGEISRQQVKTEAAIYAIVQEAVNNALKHAQARTITVQVKETSAEICATVIDDGRGFDVDRVLQGYEQRDSLGLINIKERADLVGGVLAIESRPGQGTRIVICVPKQENSA